MLNKKYCLPWRKIILEIFGKNRKSKILENSQNVNLSKIWKSSVFSDLLSYLVPCFNTYVMSTHLSHPLTPRDGSEWAVRNPDFVASTMMHWNNCTVRYSDCVFWPSPLPNRNTPSRGLLHDQVNVAPPSYLYNIIMFIFEACDENASLTVTCRWIHDNDTWLLINPHFHGVTANFTDAWKQRFWKSSTPENNNYWSQRSPQSFGISLRNYQWDLVDFVRVVNFVFVKLL